MKDNVRDYATSAFRFYAINGRSAELYKKFLYEEALQSVRKSETYVKSGIGKPTESSLMAAENTLNEKVAELRDMEAIELTMIELKIKRQGKEIIQAVELVYFKDAEKPIEKGDIHNRVIAATMIIPASERSIYYWLYQARQLFVLERGLRNDPKR